MAKQIKVVNCINLLACTAFYNEVTYVKLSWSLAKKLEPTLRGCLNRATKFIEAEDIMLAKDDKYFKCNSPAKSKEKDKEKENKFGSSRRPDYNRSD